VTTKRVRAIAAGPTHGYSALVAIDRARAIGERLYPNAAARKLERLRRMWSLSKSEAGDLFGVSRQAILKWVQRGVPAERVADVAAVYDLARELERNLRPDRIPTIVRRRAKGLGGRTLLETVRDAGVEPVYRYLARLENYDGA